MIRRGFLFLLSVSSAAVYLLLAGCVGPVPESPPPPPPPPPPAVDPFCAALAEPFCEAMYGCCVNGFHLMRVQAGVTVEECKKNWSSGVCLNAETRAAIEASVAAGYTIYNPAKLDACVAHLKPLAAGGYACVAPPQEVMLTECLNAFEAQIPPGDKCTWDLDGPIFGWTSFVQCKDGLCEEGKCIPLLQTGDACPTGDTPGLVPRNETCNYSHGEWCKGAGDTGICGPREEIGGACNLGTPDNPHGYECRSVNCDRTTSTCIPSSRPTADAYGCTSF